MSTLPASAAKGRLSGPLLHVLRKTLWMLLVLWGITIISFWVIHLAPGSPTDMETTLNPLAGAAARQRLEVLYGLDRPLYVQYWDWLSRIVHLDFGNSMEQGQRVYVGNILNHILPYKTLRYCGPEHFCKIWLCNDIKTKTAFLVKINYSVNQKTISHSVMLFPGTITLMQLITACIILSHLICKIIL